MYRPSLSWANGLRLLLVTPNTDTVGDLGDPSQDPEELQKKEEDMLIGHELAKEFDESGNSSDA